MNNLNIPMKPFHTKSYKKLMILNMPEIHQHVSDLKTIYEHEGVEQTFDLNINDKIYRVCVKNNLLLDKNTTNITSDKDDLNFDDVVVPYKSYKKGDFDPSKLGWDRLLKPLKEKELVLDPLIIDYNYNVNIKGKTRIEEVSIPFAVDEGVSHIDYLVWLEKYLFDNGYVLKGKITIINNVVTFILQSE